MATLLNYFYAGPLSVSECAASKRTVSERTGSERTGSEQNWLIGLGLLSLSMLVWAQTADQRSQITGGIDKTVTDRIVEDAPLWRQSPAEDIDTGWRVEPRTRDSRVTWGYDSSYEQLRDKHYEFSGSPSFDYSEDRAGSLLRFDF